jgi:hypothetical protein
MIVEELVEQDVEDLAALRRVEERQVERMKKLIALKKPLQLSAAGLSGWAACGSVVLRKVACLTARGALVHEAAASEPSSRYLLLGCSHSPTSSV